MVCNTRSAVQIALENAVRQSWATRLQSALQFQAVIRQAVRTHLACTCVQHFCLALSPLISTFHTLEKQCCWLICRSYLYLIEVGLMIPTFLTRCCSSNKRMNNSITNLCQKPNRVHIHADTRFCVHLYEPATGRIVLQTQAMSLPSDLGAPFQLSGPPSTSSTSFFVRSIDLLICR